MVGNGMWHMIISPQQPTLACQRCSTRHVLLIVCPQGVTLRKEAIQHILFVVMVLLMLVKIVTSRALRHVPTKVALLVLQKTQELVVHIYVFALAMVTKENRALKESVEME